MSQFLSVLQVSVVMGVSRQTVWRWIRSGRLPARVIGHTYVVAQSNVERMVKVRKELEALGNHPMVRRRIPERARVMRTRGDLVVGE